MTIVYLNGKFLPIEAACIPVTDRGFLFGDGVYEVIPAYGGKLFRLPQHLKRLQNSLDGIRLGNPHNDREWSAILTSLLEHNRALGGPDDDQSIYLQVTRGSAPKRDHSFPQDVVPTVFAMSSAISAPEPAVMQQGIAAITLDDIRWQYCDIKAVTLLANVLLKQQALDRGAGEAILVREDRVIEGSASNVFVVENGNILTPAKGPEMLTGITRDLVLELAQQHQLPCQETDVSEAQLRGADEIWITSSTREIMPVTLLDGRAVGLGAPGPVWKTMIGFYQAYKASIRRGAAE
jgi:D-alanine transaminase